MKNQRINILILTLLIHVLNITGLYPNAGFMCYISVVYLVPHDKWRACTFFHPACSSFAIIVTSLFSRPCRTQGNLRVLKRKTSKHYNVYFLCNRGVESRRGEFFTLPNPCSRTMALGST
jgi:hypothetical protein